MAGLNVPHGAGSQPIMTLGKILERGNASTQERAEANSLRHLEQALEIYEVADRQSEATWAWRRELRESEDLTESVLQMIDEVIDSYVADAGSRSGDGPDLDYLRHELSQLYPVRLSAGELAEAAAGPGPGQPGTRLTDVVKADARAAYDRRRNELGPAVMHELERTVIRG